MCRKTFVPRFSYQTEATDASGAVRHYCSQACRVPELRGDAAPRRRPSFTAPAAAAPVAVGARMCSVCNEAFTPEYAFQALTVDGQRRWVCSQLCRRGALSPASDTELRRVPRAIAVLNQKGGTAKTTTAVSVAAGLAERGLRTLLIDLDAQGNVGVSLGVQGQRSLYHVLIDGLPPEEVAVPVRSGLDVITSDASLASVEIQLVRARDRARVLRRRAAAMIAPTSPYDYIVLDCAPSLSLLNQNALTFAREVLVPVSCDYLALVGVKQILRTLRHVNEVLHHPVEVLGVLPTFYDVRNNISKESVGALTSYFKDKVLPPIRVNARLKEAPSHKKTIFEYAPDSHGAEDYLAVVDWLVERDPRPLAQRESSPPGPVVAAATEASVAVERRESALATAAVTVR